MFQQRFDSKICCRAKNDYLSIKIQLKITSRGQCFHLVLENMFENSSRATFDHFSIKIKLQHLIIFQFNFNEKIKSKEQMIRCQSIFNKKISSRATSYHFQLEYNYKLSPRAKCSDLSVNIQLEHELQSNM